MLIDVGKKVFVDVLFNSQNKIEFLHMYVIVIILALMSVFSAYFHICLFMYIYGYTCIFIVQNDENNVISQASL